MIDMLGWYYEYNTVLPKSSHSINERVHYGQEGRILLMYELSATILILSLIPSESDK
jgi:hypothetical protein